MKCLNHNWLKFYKYYVLFEGPPTFKSHHNFVWIYWYMHCECSKSHPNRDSRIYDYDGWPHGVFIHKFENKNKIFITTPVFGFCLCFVYVLHLHLDVLYLLDHHTTISKYQVDFHQRMIMHICTGFLPWSQKKYYKLSLMGVFEQFFLKK